MAVCLIFELHWTMLFPFNIVAGILAALLTLGVALSPTLRRPEPTPPPIIFISGLD